MTTSIYSQYPHFTSDYLVRFSDGVNSRLIGLSTLFNLLGDKTDRVLAKVLSSTSHQVVIKPFHGLSFTFIYR